MNGKLALVTGAATGIGAAVSRQLIARGARVALLDVNSAVGGALATEIGGNYFDCDVADFEAMSAVIDTCCEQLGAPDYVHLNAGVMTVPAGAAFLPIEEVSIEQYRHILGVNISGVFHGVKLLLPHMKERGGAITITASTTGLGVLPVDPLYATTKYALIGLARSVAAAQEGSALRVNVICPGVVDTAIVPEEFKAPEFGVMPADEMAAEVIDLLENGANGEVRVKVKDTPGFNVPPQDQGL